MSSIKIGADERPLAAADPHWITQEIVQRRNNGLVVCVVVVIKTPDLDLRLATPSCGSGGGGGGRLPTNRESALIDLWRKHRLDQPDFSPGSVVAFVAQVRQYL